MTREKYRQYLLHNTAIFYKGWQDLFESLECLISIIEVVDMNALSIDEMDQLSVLLTQYEEQGAVNREIVAQTIQMIKSSEAIQAMIEKRNDSADGQEN